jgi:hypothetical protein
LAATTSLPHPPNADVVARTEVELLPARARRASRADGTELLPPWVRSKTSRKPDSTPDQQRAKGRNREAQRGFAWLVAESAVKDLISTSTRGQFRQLMTTSTDAAIVAAFQDAGFAPNPDCTYDDTSVRRTRTQEYLQSVNWTDPDHVDRACRAFERLLTGWPEGPELTGFYNALRRDGCTVDYPGTGMITPPAARGPLTPWRSLSSLTDPAAIQQQLDRLQRAVIDDPAFAIGTAKELIESTAKCVLIERGLPVNDKDDVPALARAAQEALGLHPSTAPAGPDSSDAIRKILGAVTTIANSLAELRNSYGTGHGRSSVRTGLRARHANLAVHAATTWCQLVLDTLADPDAPWRNAP